MALTLSFDGTGIVAYADGQTTDTGGGSWDELGAGSVADNPDVYLYGSNSFGSKYASKEGRTYYQDDGTINYTANAGEILYSSVNIQSNGAFRTYGTGTFNGPFNVIAGSSTANLRHWNVAAKGASNGWTGGWKIFAVDPNITTGTETEGTPVITAFNTFGVWIDTDVSVRADSVFQDMIISAKGAIATGSPTVSGEAFDELAIWCTDYANRVFGLIEVRGNTYFQKGGVTVGDGTTLTAFTCDGNNIECEESAFYNGTTWVTSYPADANHITTLANASVSYTNVNHSGFIDNKLQWDTSLGNASSVTGGAIKLAGSWSVKATDTFSAVIFNTNDAFSLGTASYDDCSFVACGTQTITTSITSFDNNTFKPLTGIDAVSTASLNTIVGGVFESGGTGNAVILTGAAGSYTWDCTTTGYDTGTADDGVEVTGGSITGDETIHITATTGTFSISVNSGKTVPSVSSAGAIVNVAAGQATYTQTMNDKDTGSPIEGVAVTMSVSDGTGSYPYQESVTITSATGTATVTHTAHGMKVGHKVNIQGANENEYNRIKTILTVPTANSYTYAVSGTPASPATGTITSTAVIVDGLTNASGQISDTRGYGGTNQPISGTARKGSGAPVYKSTPITGIIDSANGVSITTIMTSD